MAPIRVSIRVATQDEFVQSPSQQSVALAGGYAPYLIEWVGPTIQTDNGEVPYSGIPPMQSVFYGKTMPMGYTYYSEWAGILADMLAQKPNAKWYLQDNGSIDRH